MARRRTEAGRRRQLGRAPRTFRTHTAPRGLGGRTIWRPGTYQYRAWDAPRRALLDQIPTSVTRPLLDRYAAPRTFRSALIFSIFSKCTFSGQGRGKTNLVSSGALWLWIAFHCVDRCSFGNYNQLSKKTHVWDRCKVARSPGGRFTRKGTRRIAARGRVQNDGFVAVGRHATCATRQW